MPEKTVQKEPSKKPVPSKKAKPQQEVVVQIPLLDLHPFPDHPFQVREDASMQETAESVKEYGVLVPALARPRRTAVMSCRRPPTQTRLRAGRTGHHARHCPRH